MPVNQTLSHIWHFAIGGGVPKRSAVVAIIVGTVLNLINQGDALLHGLPINGFKLVLTYIVPYLVATYGAVSFQMRAAKLTGPPGGRR